MLKATFLSLLLIQTLCAAWSQPPAIGYVAPALQHQYSLDSSFSTDSYHGKLLIIDFWATWCAPCVASIPHMNALAKQYSSSAILVAISHEKPAKISAWLNKANPRFEAIHLSDTAAKTSKAYEVNFIPHCAVIDQKGILRWTGHSQTLTADILDTILSRSFDPVVDAKITESNASASAQQTNTPSPNSILTFTLAASTDSSQSSSSTVAISNGQIMKMEYRNTTLLSLLKDITGYYAEDRISTNDSAALQQRYDLTYNFNSPSSISFTYDLIPGKPSASMLLANMGSALNFIPASQTEKKEIYYLTVTDTALLNKHESLNSYESSSSFSPPDKLLYKGYKLNDLARTLNSYFAGSVFYDDNNTNKTYDFTLTMGIREAKLASLQKHGLTLRKSKAKVNTLKITFSKQ